MSACLNHSDREAVSSCSVCAEPFCASCVDAPGPGATCNQCLRQTRAASLAPVDTEATALAKEALKYAIIGIFCLGIILEPIALIKANKAAKMMREGPVPSNGAGKVTAARIISGIALTLWVLGMIAKVMEKT